MKLLSNIEFVDNNGLQSIDGRYKIYYLKFGADSKVGYFVIQGEKEKTFEIISGLVPEDFFHHTCDYIRGLLSDDMFIYKIELKRVIKKLITVFSWFSGVQCEMPQEEIDTAII